MRFVLLNRFFTGITFKSNQLLRYNYNHVVQHDLRLRLFRLNH
ncbi:MAG: hypothetical protein ACI96G_001252, partial [Flavobacterium sp.]